MTSSSQTFAGTDGSYAFSYGYNFLALESITYPSQRRVGYGFDVAGRVSTVNSTLGSYTTRYVTNVAYTPQGAVKQITHGTGYYEQTCYNNRLQVQTIMLRTAPPTAECLDTVGNVWQLHLDYGTSNNGNVSEQTISDGTSWSVHLRIRRREPANSSVHARRRVRDVPRWGRGWGKRNTLTTEKADG